jgi:hypothetical protein
MSSAYTIGREQVVESCAHAAGQLADGLQFLRLVQRRLRAHALGHFLRHAGLEFVVEVLEVALGEDLLRGFHARAEHAADAAGFIAQRRVGKLYQVSSG